MRSQRFRKPLPRSATVALAALWLGACQPLDDEQPPVFAEETLAVEALGGGQAALSWAPAEDDLLGPEALAYDLWFAEASQLLDLDRPPDASTEEGARAYTLQGLAPAAAYRALARARDRDGNRSDNEAALSFTTPEEGQGLVAAHETLPLAEDLPTGEIQAFFRGRAFSGLRDDLGLAVGNAVVWYENRGQAGWIFRDDLTIRLDEPAVDAIMTAVDRDRERDGRQDLLLQTQNALRLYRARDAGFGLDEGAPFAAGPLPGALDVVEDENGLLRAASFVDRAGVLRVYSREDDGGLRVEQGYVIGGRDVVARVARLDENEYEDLVFFKRGELFRALDQGADFRFGPAVSIDVVAEDDLDNGPYDPERVERRLFALDIGGDGVRDICLYWRLEANGAALLWIYDGDGDGGFPTRREVALGVSVFENPRFVRFDGGRAAFLTPQSAANNAALWDPEAWTEPTVYLGGFGRIDRALIARFDETHPGALGVALLSSEDRKMTLLQLRRSPLPPR